MENKIIKILQSKSNYHPIEKASFLCEDDFEEVATQIEDAVIWHGPDEVLPIECMFARVLGDDMRLYRYSRQNQCWMVYNEKGKCINGMWVKGTPNKWRYPAPIKK